MNADLRVLERTTSVTDDSHRSAVLSFTLRERLHRAGVSIVVSLTNDVLSLNDLSTISGYILNNNCRYNIERRHSIVFHKLNSKDSVVSTTFHKKKQYLFL